MPTVTLRKLKKQKLIVAKAGGSKSGEEIRKTEAKHYAPCKLLVSTTPVLLSAGSPAESRRADEADEPINNIYSQKNEAFSFFGIHPWFWTILSSPCKTPPSPSLPLHPPPAASRAPGALLSILFASPSLHHIKRKSPKNTNCLEEGSSHLHTASLQKEARAPVRSGSLPIRTAPPAEGGGFPATTV